MPPPEKVNPGRYFQRPTTLTLSAISITYRLFVYTYTQNGGYYQRSALFKRIFFFAGIFFTLSDGRAKYIKKNGCNGMGHLVRRSRFLRAVSWKGAIHCPQYERKRVHRRDRAGLNQDVGRKGKREIKFPGIDQYVIDTRTVFSVYAKGCKVRAHQHQQKIKGRSCGNWQVVKEGYVTRRVGGGKGGSKNEGKGGFHVTTRGSCSCSREQR